MIAVVMRDGAVLQVLYILLTGHVGQGEGALSGSVETEII